MTTAISLEIGRQRARAGAKCICRLTVNGERRGKISLTEAEGKILARILAAGCSLCRITFSLVNLN